MKFKYTMNVATDIGLVRKVNEDSLRIMPAINLAVVADGMGGHKAGEVASHMAVNSLCDYFAEQATVGVKSDRAMSAISSATMVDAFSLANSQVYAHAQQVESCRGMGTTLVAASFQSGIIQIGHIGDSRIYCFSDSKLKQLTTDHTLAAKLSAEHPDWHESKLPAYSHHVLHKALGIKASCRADFFTATPQHNQVYLMCSDGLTGAVNDNDIAAILLRYVEQPERCLETLIGACLENGAPDNISIVLVYVSRLPE